MGKTAIIADSTCDLSAELTKRYEVTIIPLHILLGEEEFRDGTEITPQEIYTWADENRTTPKTSAVSVSDVSDAYRKVLSEADEAVAFCISESMSSTGEVMRVTAEQMGLADRVYVIDSQNLSTGIGLLVIEAAVMAQQGMRGAQIVSRIEALIPKVRASFVVDTLTYLYRGGRCSGLSALAGSALKLHPMITVKNGAMGAGKKYRGRMEKVIMAYVGDLLPQISTARPQRVFITHSGCDDAVVGAVKARLESLQYFYEILVTVAGGVVSSHCGPGTLGVLFIAE